MPLFSRSDGTPVATNTLTRRILPFIMPTRSESAIYYEQLLDLTETLPFIERYNASHEQRLTLFHIVLAGLGRALVARPGLNRFVMGSTIYQRNGVELSFAAKRALADYAPLVTVKIPFDGADLLADVVARVLDAVGEGRGDSVRPVDTELKWFLRLPAGVLRALVWLMRWLDRHNLLPAAVTRHDPMYTSVFVANLGSIGIDRVYHHLYEYGTASVFCAIGRVEDQVVVGDDGSPTVRRGVRLRYTFDERINDGHYCARALEIVRDAVERPETLLEPTGSEADPGSFDAQAAGAALAEERQRLR